MDDSTKGKIKRRVGDNLIRAGAVIGALGAIAMAIKLKIELSPGIQQLFFYKGTFAAAAVLLVLGAWYGRQGRIEEAEAKTLEELASPAGFPVTDKRRSTTEKIQRR